MFLNPNFYQNTKVKALKQKPVVSNKQQLNFGNFKFAGKTLDKYINSLEHYNLQDADLLYRKTDFDLGVEIILLKEPQKFEQACSSLNKIVKGFKNSCSDKNFTLNSFYTFFKKDSECFEKAIAENKNLKDTFVCGIVGKGSSSTAFVTDEDDVIKMSKISIFPSEENMVPGVDIPIKERYISALSGGAKIYTLKEPLAENTHIRKLNRREFQKIWDNFYQKLKQANSIYEFEDDFSPELSFFSKQMGFVEDAPYLLDHQCIANRPLVI